MSTLNLKRSFEETNTTADTQPALKTRVSPAVPKLVASRYNWRVHAPCYNVQKNKDSGEPELKIQNENGYGYQLLCPPGRGQHVSLSEGGNLGRFDWSKTEKGATLSLQYASGGLPQAETAQKDFLQFLQTVQNTAFEKLFHTVPALKEKAMKKAKLVAKDKSESELESLALKLHVKGAKSPLKMNPDGSYYFQVKCGAFNDRDGTYVPRKVNLYDQKYKPIVEKTTVLNGAIVGPIMTIRLYTTPGYATYGVTYQLSDRHMILYRQGTGSQKVDSATLDKWDRPYKFKSVVGRNGKTNVYVNDLNGGRYAFRPPSLKTKFVDLDEGTLGKFPGVTEANAKLTASFIETDEETTKFFDHIEQLSKDAAQFMFNDDTILKNQKAELKTTAESLAEETGADVQSTFFSLFMDTIQTPMNKDNDGGRILRSNQSAFSRNGKDEEGKDIFVRNSFTYEDVDCDPLKEIQLEKGCSIQPVLEPSTYILANGTAGISLKISLYEKIRVTENVTMEDNEDNAPPTYEF